MTPRALRSVRSACSAAAIAFALTFGLASCTPSGDDLTAELHGSVVQIAERAAAGDFAGALAELDLLDRDVTTAVEAGEIDDAREGEIRAAIELVRADLVAAATPSATTPPPAPATEGDDDGEDDDPGNSGNGNGNGNGGNSGNGGNGNSGTGGESTVEPTEPPASEPPATEPPATEPPATEPPATVSPDSGE